MGGEGVEVDWETESARERRISLALPMLSKDDQADLRLSQTMRKTRIKKIWSMTDSRFAFERGGGSGSVGIGAGGAGREGEEWERGGT